MTVLSMSSAEIIRFDTLMRLDRGEIRIADAMELLGLARRQVYRLLGDFDRTVLPGSCRAGAGGRATGGSVMPSVARSSRLCVKTTPTSGLR